MARVRPLLLALLLLVLTSTGALAHAGLISTAPAEGEVVASAPATVILTFTEPVAPLRFTLISQHGQGTELGPASQDGARIVIGLPPGLDRGSYLLSWRVTSEDGHPVSGSLGFSIGAAGELAALEQPGMGLFPAMIWAVRAGQYAALFFGLGSLVFASLVAPAGGPAPRGARILAGLGLVLVPVAIGLQGLDLIGAPPAALLGTEPWRASLASSYGITQLLLAGAFALALLPSRRTLALALLAGIAAPALSGHASTASPQVLMRLAVAAHMAALMLWLGALWPLLAGLRTDGLAALQRFSRLVPCGIALLLLSGVALAAVQLGPPAASWTSPYAILLAAKLGLVAVLLAIALWNRLSLTAAARQGRSLPLRRSIGVEIVLVLAVLGLVAGWRFTTPPRVLDAVAAASAPLVVPLAGEGRTGTITLTPGHTGLVDVAVELDTAAQALEVQFSQPSADLATISRQALATDGGRWIVTGVLLPVPGDWTVVTKARLGRFDLTTLATTFSLSSPGKDQDMKPSQLAAAAALAAVLSSAPALAQEASAAPHAMADSMVVTVGDLRISGAFSRATLPNAPVGAGYMTILNTGPEDDRLVSASAPFAGVTQVHEMKMEGDVMKMNELPDGLLIPAGSTVTLEPGGYHMMFMQLREPLVEGTMVPVTLTFEKAGTVEVQLAVGTINADEPAHDMQGM